ncbi:phosphatase 2C-like domain-containing protein [Mycena amicta]|nr:phosphatase 2C-like domain-containing protein [Mycena amicta]
MVTECTGPACQQSRSLWLVVSCCFSLSMAAHVTPGIDVDILPTKGEDRTVIFPFEHGTMIAIFDGHFGADLADWAARIIPSLVVRAFDPTANAEDLEQTIVNIFHDFDQALLLPVTELFEDDNWMDERWDDVEEIYKVIGEDHSAPQYSAGRRAVVGTTVLLGIIDKAKQSIWVVSLGDSCAVRGRMQDGKMSHLLMNDFHNTGNKEEVERIHREHPGERDLVGRSVLNVLNVTRSLGDHLLKVDLTFAHRILCWFRPSPVGKEKFQRWWDNGNLTPPYLSCIPTVRKFDLLPGDILVFASDGLADSMAEANPLVWSDPNDCWEVIMPLLIGQDDDRVGHRCFRPKGEFNQAELLIRNVLFGDDKAKMSKVLMDRWRDDISVVVVEVDDLAW